MMMLVQSSTRSKLIMTMGIMMGIMMMLECV